VTARPILDRADLGGTEQAIQNLAAALTARAHHVALHAGPATSAGAAVCVAVNDASLLPERPGLPVVWFHNEVGLWREARKCRLPALWRHWPVAVFAGSEQARRASRILPFRRRVTLAHGLPSRILQAPPADRPPPLQAVFLSQAYRGLKEVLILWRNTIESQAPSARLTAYVGEAEVPFFRTLAGATASIRIVPRVANAAVPEILRGARVVLAPGHVSETFCLAAAEAIAMGVPVVTLGKAALKERVRHGETGFICTGWADMAWRVRMLFNDDALWQRMQANGIATRAFAGWDHAASRWESLLDADTGRRD
jgi:hypothetical protein